MFLLCCRKMDFVFVSNLIACVFLQVSLVHLYYGILMTSDYCLLLIQLGLLRSCEVCCLRPALAKDVFSDLFLEMSLFWICSYGGFWLGVSCKGLWFRSSPSEVPDSHPDLQRFLLPAYSLGGRRLTSGPAELLTQVCSLKSLRFMHVLWWSLALAHSAVAPLYLFLCCLLSPV